MYIQHTLTTSGYLTHWPTHSSQVSSLHFDVEMTLGASGCDQCVDSVGVASGCGHWVVNILFTS